MNRRAVSWVGFGLLAAVVACKDKGETTPTPTAAAVKTAPATPVSFAELWVRLPQSAHGCPDVADYWPEGGLKTFYCHAKTLVTFDALQRASGMKAFVEGPHGDAALKLDSEGDFGRYNPKFAQWLVNETLAAVTGPEAVKAGQKAYDRYIKRLARVYLLAKRRLDVSGAVKSQEKAYLLEYISSASPDDVRPLDRLARVEPPGMTRTYGPAVAFWLRRAVDGTDDIFVAGLDRLVRTYDVEFIRTMKISPLPDPGADRQPASARVQPKLTLKFSGGTQLDLIKNLWAHVGAAPNTCPNVYEYKPGGLRLLYCYGKAVAGFDVLSKLSALVVFRSGPHQDGLDLRNERAFGHYNPVFVKWVRDAALPAVALPDVAPLARQTYARRAGHVARAFYVARRWMELHPKEAAAIQKSYARWIETGEGENPRWSMWERIESPVYELQAIGGSGIAFWMRREMDGTAAMWAETLERALQTFDPKFLQATRDATWKDIAAHPERLSGNNP